MVNLNIVKWQFNYYLPNVINDLCIYIWNIISFCGPKDILSGKRSKCFPLKPCFQVPVYIENEQSLTILYNYMKGVLTKTQTQLTYNDEVEFICGCLLPEVSPKYVWTWACLCYAVCACFILLIALFVQAILHGLCELQGLSWQEAEEMFLQGPIYHSIYVFNFCFYKNCWMFVLHNTSDNSIYILL